MCWGIPPAENGGWGGQSTVTLVSRGYISPLAVDALRPGDAVGICGTGTAGDNGHIVLFVGWVNDDPTDNRYHCAEQMGGVDGPVHHIRTFDGAGDAWRAWRYRQITEDGALPVAALEGYDRWAEDSILYMLYTWLCVDADEVTSVHVVDGSVKRWPNRYKQRLAEISAVQGQILDAVEALEPPELTAEQLAAGAPLAAAAAAAVAAEIGARLDRLEGKLDRLLAALAAAATAAAP